MTGGIIGLIFLACAPPLGLLFYILWIDREAPEPTELVWRCFRYGAWTVFPAAFIEIMLMNQFLPAQADGDGASLFWVGIQSFVIIAPVEELFKWIAVHRGVWRDPHFDQPLDGVVYSLSAAMGFALAENLFYVLDKGVYVGLLRALTSIPLHAVCGVWIGEAMGRARFAGDEVRGRMIFNGIGWAVGLHGLYDFFCLSGEPGLILMIFPLMFGVAWKARSAIYSLARESALGAIPSGPTAHPMPLSGAAVLPISVLPPLVPMAPPSMALAEKPPAIYWIFHTGGRLLQIFAFTGGGLLAILAFTVPAQDQFFFWIGWLILVAPPALLGALFRFMFDPNRPRRMQALGT